MKNLHFLLFFFILILCSCGTTRIQLSKNIKANIYIDGENRGTSPVTITRTGFPTARHVSVKDFKGNEITSITIKRSITTGTILFALIPFYGTIPSLLFNWKYKREIIVPIPAKYKHKSSWGDEDEIEKEDGWDK